MVEERELRCQVLVGEALRGPPAAWRAGPSATAAPLCPVGAPHPLLSLTENVTGRDSASFVVAGDREEEEGESGVPPRPL